MGVQALSYSISGFDSPGTDNKWNTADDHFHYGVRVEFNSKGDVITEKHVTDFGQDQRSFTADDKYVLSAEQKIFVNGSEEVASIYSRYMYHQKDLNDGVLIWNLPQQVTLMVTTDSSFCPVYGRGQNNMFTRGVGVMDGN